MGEEDITTVNAADSEKIIVSQQPLLGSLFKSQNGATWDPSQLEDLKFNLYRANFSSTSGSVNFYNPDLDIGNRQIVSLAPNPIDMVSYNAVVGLAKSLTTAEQTGLTEGTTIYQQSNPNFKANLNKLLGAIGIGSNLTITDAGTGFASTSVVYSNVPLLSKFGRGSGATVNLTVNGGVGVAATVAIGGTGYAAGDVLTVSATNTGGFGKDLQLSIPNNVGIISAFNTLVLNNIQGVPKVDSSSSIVYVGGSGTSIVNGASISYLNNIADGLHFRVRHANHGMYSPLDQVVLSGVEPDVKPEKLTATIDSSSTGNIVVTSVGIFTSFEGVEVSSSNPGYAKLGNEIIRYTGVTTSSSSLNNITRSMDETKAGDYNINDKIFKYEMNSVSLRRINTSHKFNDTDSAKYPVDVDHYWLKVGISSRGLDRATGNSSGLPELFFKETKSGGSYDQQYVQVGTPYGPMATQNIAFNIVRPNVSTLLPDGTDISGRIRTFSSNSPDGNLSAFVDQGFEPVSLNAQTHFESPRMVASKVNEDRQLSDLPGNKSLTFEVLMTSDNPNVSPVVDLDRVSTVLTTNRINSPVSNFATDSRVNETGQDPCSSTYVSNLIQLANPATAITVEFAAYRRSGADIRVFFKTIAEGSSENSMDVDFELFPGFDNIDQNGKVIRISNNSGRPDDQITPSVGSEFKDYTFSSRELPPFTKFQIKIDMVGTNQAQPPLIKELRAIALA